MPSKPPFITEQVSEHLHSLGQAIRQKRKTLGVSAATTAQAAGISRVTLHRIEKGEPAVTIGAYSNVLAALGMSFAATTSLDSVQGSLGKSVRAGSLAETIPVRIEVAKYPQLAKLAWQVHGVDMLTPKEAWDIYERNERHVDQAMLSRQERDLMAALEQALGGRVSV